MIYFLLILLVISWANNSVLQKENKELWNRIEELQKEPKNEEDF